MFIAKVKGTVVTTQKVQNMTGRKLLLVEPLQVDDAAHALKGTARTLVAVDSIGAGTDDLVLVTQGSSVKNMTKEPIGFRLWKIDEKGKATNELIPLAHADPPKEAPKATPAPAA